MKRTQTKKLFKSPILLKKIQNNIVRHRHRFIKFRIQRLAHPKLEPRNSSISAFDSTILNYNQLESCRKVLIRNLRKYKYKRTATYFSRVKSTTPCTSKSKNARMGKGKGGVNHFVTRIKMFDSPFILRRVSLPCATRIARRMSDKSPIKIGIVADVRMKHK
jgi:ribosomal protein L16/L10AE